MSGPVHRAKWLQVSGASEGESSLLAKFEIGSKSHEVFFRSKDIQLDPSGGALVCLSLYSAMKSGGGVLKVEAATDEVFRANLEEVVRIYQAWTPALSPVTLKSEASPEQEGSSSPPRVAAFFSGGVDSFFSTLACSDEVTDLVFVHGFDIKLANREFRDAVSERLQKAARSLGKNLIEIETNLREYCDRYGGWGPVGHGPALATIAWLLGPDFRKVILPSSHTYDDLCPWGSHPMLDPLWSGRSLSLFHHGLNTDRNGKVAAIMANPIVREHLRVCWAGTENFYNCGKCEKCMRTMLSIRLQDGELGGFPFEESLDLRRVARLRVKSKSVFEFTRPLAEMARKNPSFKDEWRALQRGVRGYRFRQIKVACKDWFKALVP